MAAARSANDDLLSEVLYKDEEEISSIDINHQDGCVDSQTHGLALR